VAENIDSMVRRRIRLLIVGVLLVVAAIGAGWYAYTAYRKAQFLRELHLVGFSTSLIGPPPAEMERAAQEKAEDLNIDLFAAYRENPDKRVRCDLAWMLITKESLDYYEFAKNNVASVPWPEVRIWAIREKRESLSSDYRRKLLDLLLASPTSEAKLVVARWYHKQGKVNESEDAYYAAMTNGLFWDALDAADELLESERYCDEAVSHLISVVRDSEHFVSRAAYSLANLHDAREDLEPLVKSCDKEPPDSPSRQRLVAKLKELVDNDRPEATAANENTP